MKHILLTRPFDGAQEFAAQLEAAGIARDVITISPVLKIEPVAAQPDFSGSDGVVITSGRAIGSLVDAPAALPIHCVGQGTANKLRLQGREIGLVASTASELAVTLGRDCADQNLTYLRGETISVDLAGKLKDSGTHLDQYVVYRQSAQALSDAALRILRDPGDVLLPIFSEQSAAFLVRQFESRWNSRRIGICLSQKVADMAGKENFSSLKCVAKPEISTMKQTVLSIIADSQA